MEVNHYLVFLRGINVGGKGLVKMSELKTALEKAGFKEAKTYIQSGNILLNSNQPSKQAVAQKVVEVAKASFNLDVAVAVFTANEWRGVIEDAPRWWGADSAWKHNILILIKPYDMNEVVALIGDLKPNIETMQVGKGVLYQSMSRELFGKTTTSKLASSKMYKNLTIRNFNTAIKLVKLL